jgi:1,2-phenylacetyl-CoA epoxidase catalytic subunit
MYLAIIIKMKDMVRAAMIKQITADLTIGMEDEDNVAYTPSEIRTFINQHEQEIAIAVNKMCEALENEGETDWEDDCIREFLYDEIPVIR